MLKFILTIIILSISLTVICQSNYGEIKDTVGKGLVPFIIEKGDATLKFYLSKKIQMEVKESMTYVTGIKKNMNLYVDYFLEGREKENLSMVGSGCSISNVGNKTICIKFGKKLFDFSLSIVEKQEDGSIMVAEKFQFKIWGK